MPRPNPPRTIGSEATLAERIAFEREQRGMTYEGLAAAMTAAGCPVDKSAIHRIEKGEPRRKVSVDEVVALTKVFDLNFEELLMPMPLVEQRRGQELASEMFSAMTDYDEVIRRLLRVHLEFFVIARDLPELREYVTNQVAARQKSTPSGATDILMSRPEFQNLDQGRLREISGHAHSVLTRIVDLSCDAASRED